jgi:hypothetical protein
MIRSMEGFTFASALDINMGYYHINLDAHAQKLCTIVFLWYMGNINKNAYPWVSRLPQMFFKISCLSLFKIWNMLRLTFYLDDLLILTNNSFKDHLLKLEMVLARLSTAGMRVNTSKSKYFAEQIEYLVYKVEAILIIKAPKIRKEYRTTPVYCYSQLLSRHVVSQK